MYLEGFNGLRDSEAYLEIQLDIKLILIVIN